MKRKTGYLIYSILGVLFVFFCMTGGTLAEQGNNLWTGKWIVKLSMVCLNMGIALGSLTAFVLYKLEDFVGKKSIRKRKRSGSCPVPNRCLGFHGCVPWFVGCPDFWLFIRGSMPMILSFRWSKYSFRRIMRTIPWHIHY